MNDPDVKIPRSWTAEIGIIFFALGSAAAGVLDVIWREFEPAHQPIQAWGDHLARNQILAYVAAALLIIGGIGLCIRPIARWGASILAIVYASFTFFPVPRLVTAPQFLGYHVTVYIGLFVGICQQLILLAAAAIACASLSSSGSRSVMWVRVARWIFGLCSIDFGLAHFTNVQAVARMVPAWLPFGGAFWSIITGVAFITAGLALILRLKEVLAAQLLGLMLFVFSATVLTPGILTDPHSHVAWGGDAYNLAAVGSMWIFASWLASRPPSRRHYTLAGRPLLSRA